jgi:hypothetical protein
MKQSSIHANIMRIEAQRARKRAEGDRILANEFPRLRTLLLELAESAERVAEIAERLANVMENGEELS